MRWTKQKEIIFFESLAKKYGIFHPSDWGKLNWKKVVKEGGSILLKKYGGLFKSLKIIYPEVQWKEEWFRYPPRGYWRLKENRRKIMDNLAKKYNIKQPSDWENIPEIEEIGFLSNYYGNSLYRALKDIYPETEWNKEWFGKEFWTKTKQRKFLDQIAIRLKVKSPKDWGTIPVRAVLRSGANHFMKRYGHSLFRTLQAVYPDIKWERKWFVNIPLYRSKHWDSLYNQRKFLDSIRDNYNISNMREWQRITSSVIKSNGGAALLRRYNNSLYHIVATVYSKNNFAKENGEITRPHGNVLKMTKDLFSEKHQLINFLSFPGLHVDVGPNFVKKK